MSKVWKKNVSKSNDQTVFISYSSHDRGVAATLAKMLAHHGINVWFDQFDIKVGENWDEAIENGLTSASAMIILVGHTTIESYHVMDEFSYFVEHKDKEKIMVVKVDDTIKVPFRLSACTTIELGNAFDQAISDIKGFITGKGIDLVESQEKEAINKGYMFLSYAEEDSHFVDTIKDFMQKHEYAYWDYRESDRDYQSLLDDELEEVINNAVATVSIQSNNWRKAKYPKKEYKYSELIEKPIFLLRFEEMKPTLATAGDTYIDFSTDSKSGFAKLKKEFIRQGL